MLLNLKKKRHLTLYSCGNANWDQMTLSQLFIDNDGGGDSKQSRKWRNLIHIWVMHFIFHFIPFVMLFFVTLLNCYVCMCVTEFSVTKYILVMLRNSSSTLFYFRFYKWHLKKMNCQINLNVESLSWSKLDDMLEWKIRNATTTTEQLKR